MGNVPTLDRVDQKLDDLKELVVGIVRRMDDKEKMDPQRYAAKWVERLTVGLVTFVLLTVLYVVIHNVIPTEQEGIQPGVSARK